MIIFENKSYVGDIKIEIIYMNINIKVLFIIKAIISFNSTNYKQQLLF